MVSMNFVCFAVGLAVGVVLATVCLVFAAIYDDYEEAKKCKTK